MDQNLVLHIHVVFKFNITVNNQCLILEFWLFVKSQRRRQINDVNHEKSCANNNYLLTLFSFFHITNLGSILHLYRYYYHKKYLFNHSLLALLITINVSLLIVILKEPLIDFSLRYNLKEYCQTFLLYKWEAHILQQYHNAFLFVH